ncbi:hypothetical protein [Salinarchaeum chitinilyticum]
MSDEQVRCWLVERDYWDEDVVTLVYATPDGERFHQRQLAANLVVSLEITAAKTFDRDDLEPTPAADRERYAAEAERIAESHDPDDPI